MTTVVRDAVEADLPAVLEIYNDYLATSTAAWSEIPQTIEERVAWYRDRRGAGFPVLVAVDDDAPDEVVGFTSYGPFRGAGMWPGYRHTAELTVFVTERRCAGGVGRLLLEALVARARAGDIHVLVAGIDADNVGSIRFHERMGFTEVARMPEVGRKWDRWLDLVLLQRILG